MRVQPVPFLTWLGLGAIGRCAVCVASGFVAVHAAAHDINIDFGLPAAGPSASYAAAGLPGAWNAIEGEHTPFWDPQVIYDLVDVAGQPTGVTLYQFGGLDLFSVNDPFIHGDDAALVEDGLITFNPNLEVCLWIDGLEDGCYEVLMYGLLPGAPTALTEIRHDFTLPLTTIGGIWGGRHVEGVSFARHTVEVVDGFMGSHAGVAPEGSPAIGGVLNGMQIRRIDPADLDGDGSVGFGDLVTLLAAWGDCGMPSCVGDLDGDGTVGFGDLVTLLASWS